MGPVRYRFADGPGNFRPPGGRLASRTAAYAACAPAGDPKLKTLNRSRGLVETRFVERSGGSLAALERESPQPALRSIAVQGTVLQPSWRQGLRLPETRASRVFAQWAIPEPRDRTGDALRVLQTEIATMAVEAAASGRFYQPAAQVSAHCLCWAGSPSSSGARSTLCSRESRDRVTRRERSPAFVVRRILTAHRTIAV